jgi:predicted transcriptional regulator
LGSYRSKLDIIADILLVVRKDAKKTRIMYQANLSYKLLMKYLHEVRKASLVHFVEDRDCYVLTPKGERFLRGYKAYCRHNKHIEQHLNHVGNKRRELEELCSYG